MLARNERRALANTLRGNTQSKWNSYYSRVRFESTATSGNFTIASGLESRGFGYGVGGGMSAAGFVTTALTATFADTNIATANQTNAGENVLIKGVSLILQPNSDPHMAKQADFSISVKAVINSSLLFPLGIPSMLPGCGGLVGIGDAQTVQPDLQASNMARVGTLTNGVPIASNYFQFPDPLIWKSAGGGDSGFNILLRTEAAIQSNTLLNATPSRVAVTGTTGAGLAAYVLPSAAPVTTANAGQPGVTLDYMIVLIGRTLNPLSDN